MRLVFFSFIIFVVNINVLFAYNESEKSNNTYLEWNLINAEESQEEFEVDSVMVYSFEEYLLIEVLNNEIRDSLTRIKFNLFLSVDSPPPEL